MTKISTNIIMISPIRNTIKNLSLCMATFSYFLLINHALNFGISPVFQILIDYYDSIKNVLLYPFYPLANWVIKMVATIVPFKITLQEYWSDVFILMTLYIGSRAASYWKKGTKRHAIERHLFGMIVSFFTAVLTSLWTGNSTNSGLGVTITVVLGLMFFDIIDSSWAAIFYRSHTQTFKEEFYRYLSYCLPATLVLILSITIFLPLSINVSDQNLEQRELIFLMYSSFVLANYWLVRGWMISKERKTNSGNISRYNHFKNSSATQTAFRMFIVMISAILFCLMNAGLFLVSQPV